MNKYVVKAKIVQGITLTGFSIENQSGETKNLNLDDVINLAKSEQIDNAELLFNPDTSNYILCIDQGLINLPTIRNVKDAKITLLCRIVDNNDNCKGYKASNNAGSTYRLSIHKVWQLAVNNSVAGIKAYIKNGKKILESEEGFELSKLPKVVE